MFCDPQCFPYKEKPATVPRLFSKTSSTSAKERIQYLKNMRLLLLKDTGKLKSTKKNISNNGNSSTSLKDRII
jgi:hypothetical protein